MAKEGFKGLEHSEGIDRISSLPKPLLSRILSLLPTKYAVATSLLSTRWRFSWTSITNLDFNDEQVSYKFRKKSLDMKRRIFTQFVNRVLLLLNTHSIQNFHLMCHHELFDRFYLDSWIGAAIGRTVQKLHLHFELGHAQPMELPLSHFYCKTLAVLKLICNIHFNIAASASICFPNLQTIHLCKVTFTIASNCSVSFPSLKELILDYVKYANEESVHKLFASCPVLDSLDINRSDWDNVLCLTISIPSLRSLKTRFSCFDRLPRGPHKLHLDTPALKYLYLDDSMSEYFTAENLSSLLEATVMFDFNESLTTDVNTYSINIFKFILSLFKVKSLSISGVILKAISSISANIAPVFHNLKRLELGKTGCRDWSVVIKNLLESLDNLEHLVMRGRCHGDHESWWTEPLRVPMCLLQRVTTISFTYVSGDCSSELELIRYFLNNAKVLELLTVHSNGGSSAARFKLMRKISMMPRGSQACQIAFEG